MKFYNLLKRILQFIKNMFSDKKVLYLEEKKEDKIDYETLDYDENNIKEIELTDEDVGEYVEKYNYSKDINFDFQEEKKRIFALYDCIKKGVVNIENLSNCDLVKIFVLMKEEEKIFLENKSN